MPMRIFGCVLLCCIPYALQHCAIDTVPLPEAEKSLPGQTNNTNPSSSQPEAASDAADEDGRTNIAANTEAQGFYAIVQARMVFGLPGSIQPGGAFVVQNRVFHAASDGSVVAYLSDAPAPSEGYSYTVPEQNIFNTVPTTQCLPVSFSTENLSYVTVSETAGYMRVVSGPTFLSQQHTVVFLNATQGVLRTTIPWSDGSFDVRIPYQSNDTLMLISTTNQGPRCFERGYMFY